MKALIRRWLDPFVVLLLATMVAGLLVPVPEGVRGGVGSAADVAVTILFLVYGARLPTRDVLAGMRNIRLQGAILAATYLLFPLLGLVASRALEPVLGAPLASGVLYLTLLPSTVQSSVAFTSIARGNVAGAICAATVSNVVGMLLTPVLVLVLMGASGATGLGGLRSILLQLLLPFVVGQFLQRWVGAWIRARRWLTVLVDRGTILIVVFGAVSTATAEGTWERLSWGMIGVLLVLSAVLLAALLAATWWGGKSLHLARADRVALLMCGSKKSLATGLPMAAVLFPAATAGVIAVPVILFHQLQLVVCAALARHLAAYSTNAESAEASS